MTNNINTYGIIKIKDNVIVKLDLFSISILYKLINKYNKIYGINLLVGDLFCLFWYLEKEPILLLPSISRSAVALGFDYILFFLDVDHDK